MCCAAASAFVGASEIGSYRYRLPIGAWRSSATAKKSSQFNFFCSRLASKWKLPCLNEFKVSRTSARPLSYESEVITSQFSNLSLTPPRARFVVRWSSGDCPPEWHHPQPWMAITHAGTEGPTEAKFTITIQRINLIRRKYAERRRRWLGDGEQFLTVRWWYRLDLISLSIPPI